MPPKRGKKAKPAPKKLDLSAAESSPEKPKQTDSESETVADKPSKNKMGADMPKLSESSSSDHDDEETKTSTKREKGEKKIY